MRIKKEELMFSKLRVVICRNNKKGNLMKKRIKLTPVFIVLLSILNCSKDNTQNVPMNVQNVEFESVETSEPDSIRTLKSLKREGDLYMMTYYGDYNSRLDKLNERIIANGWYSVMNLEKINYECSIFAALGDPESPILGRNYDNNDDRGVLVGLYTPSDGYASICISNQ